MKTSKFNHIAYHYFQYKCFYSPLFYLYTKISKYKLKIQYIIIFCWCSFKFLLNTEKST